MSCIVLTSAQLPPVPDGIGDYTARLAEEMAAAGRGVVVWTSREVGEPAEIVGEASGGGVRIEQPFSLASRGGVRSLVDAMERTEAEDRLPGAIVLQFNQFSWGRWGLNPYLPRVMRAIKRRWPQVMLGVMFHEKVVPATTWKFRMMRLWQVPQYNALADIADVRFFSIQRWAEEERARRPARPSEDVVHLPVGSNLPYCPPEKAKTRAELGIPEDAVVCGVFGTAHSSRLLDWVSDAVQALRRLGHDAVVLYIGSGGDAVRRACEGNLGHPGVPVFDQGRLPAEDAAACFPAMDVYLSPFSDGISTRRGSAMAALQHGIPVVTTHGPLTDDIWAHTPGLTLSPVEDGPAGFAASVCRSLDRPVSRQAIRQWYLNHYSFECVARRLTEAIEQNTSSVDGQAACANEPGRAATETDTDELSLTAASPR